MISSFHVRCIVFISCLWSTSVFAQSAPVATYAFNETTGTATADATGNGRTGTVRNGTWTASGYFGRGLSFNGTSTWVTIADHASLDFTTGMTLEAWVRPTTLSGWRTLLLKETTGQLAYALYAHDNAPRPAAYVNGGLASEATVPGTSAIALNVWTHLAATFDGTTLRLYVNGVQVGSRASQAIVTSNGVLRIGGNAIWGEYFRGIIDEVRVYDRALSAGEIQTDMTTPVESSPKLVIQTPAANAVVAGPRVDVTYTRTGDQTGVDHVHFVLDGTEVMDMTPDGAYAFPNVAPGAHVLGGWLVRADHSKMAGTDAVTRTFTVTAPDTTPPTVTLTSPVAGASVMGTVAVTADASDNVAVAGVQFLLDGSPLGGEDTTSPFAINWNTGTTLPGDHTLTAIARDTAANSSTPSAIVVTVIDPSNPAAFGRWDAPFELGLVAVNAVLMHTGKVLLFAGSFSGASYPERVWDPQTGVFSTVPLGRTNLFCAGHSQLADGRILVIGGHDSANGILGEAETNIFDPPTQTWSPAANMAARRWYPTATTMSDGRVLATSGGTTCLTCIADVPEIYDPGTNTWTALNAARLSVPYYPFMFQLPEGRVLDAGSTEQPAVTRALNAASGAWSTIDPVVVDGYSAVMYRPGKILKSGTSTDSGGTRTIAATAYVIDMNQPTPQWRAVQSMASPRAFHNLVLLPTGDVLAVGGGTRADGYDTAFSVYEAELWSAESETWTTLARMDVPRLYHSTALLLPDGRMLSAGSGMDGPGINQTRGQLFSPPYLFKGPRPTITTVDSLLRYGSTFTVATPDVDAIDSVALMRPGAVTHGFDEDARFLNLAFTRDAGQLTVTSPPNGNYAPPGYYMLFLVADGVPSVAAWVRLPGPNEDFEPPTAPAGLTAASGIGAITLAWDAATDDTGVVAYNVHRATSAGVIPTTANRVARVSGTTLVDAVPAGAYYYVVTAEDAAGHVSLPSPEASASASADTTPPTANVTSPAPNATVSGTVTVTASASDDVAVAGVQFRLNGSALGAEDVSAPYATAWLTTGVANGIHTLTATARDASGNSSESPPVSVNVDNAAVPAGLVAAYGFDEGSGINTADASGNGNAGQVAGAAWVTAGRFGKALQFNGQSNMVSIEDAATLDLTNRMTLEAWVQPTSAGGWRTVILKERSPGLSYGLYSHDSATGPAGYLAIGGGDPAVTSATSLPLNTWSHVAMTYDGTNMRLYVNGTQVAVRAQTGSASVSSGMLRIGGNTVWGEYFAGIIDEVRIYNRALTAVEIQTDMITPITR